MEWIWTNFWELLLAILLIFNLRLLFLKLFLEPIQGDNKKVEMYELAQWVFVVLLIYVVVLNKHDPQVVLFLTGAVSAIAGVKIWKGKNNVKSGE
ncbi:MAG: hypothetical protein ACUZ9M_08640 [Candidatus Scalindua sp.]